MIYVTQGHEKSIALEIFLKSFFKLSPEEKKKLTFVGRKTDLLENLNFLNLPNSLLSELNICEIQSSRTATLDSLLCALEKINSQDVLVTLPTSKDQLFYQGKNYLGYTEFLREYFQKADLAMSFVADEEKILLLTDHIPLSLVPHTLTSEYIFSKTVIALEGFFTYISKIEEVIFAGINPHAGENGLLGHEDTEINGAILKLKKLYPLVDFKGPYSGDILHFHKSKKSQLFIYAFHDQGLPLFKAKHGLKGINLTLGLPFVRMSVDHGTAFDLYGKNLAGEEGCDYVLQTALRIQEGVQRGT